jgi:hypothetical protein
MANLQERLNMPFYRKKPVVIEAWKYDSSDFKNMPKWIDLDWMTAAENIYIPTLEGVMEARLGDYIIKGVKGEIYPCKSDIFEMTYEKL